MAVICEVPIVDECVSFDKCLSYDECVSFDECVSYDEWLSFDSCVSYDEWLPYDECLSFAERLSFVECLLLVECLTLVLFPFSYRALFAKEPYKRDDILQKRPIIIRSILVPIICL